jgi:hypothetical protein
MATTREHRDRVVRLHGGSEHGRIVTLPDGPLRDGLLHVPVAEPLGFLDFGMMSSRSPRFLVGASGAFNN